jgi:hypothetical protein
MNDHPRPAASRRLRSCVRRLLLAVEKAIAATHEVERARDLLVREGTKGGKHGKR